MTEDFEYMVTDFIINMSLEARKWFQKCIIFHKSNFLAKLTFPVRGICVWTGHETLFKSFLF